MDVAAPATPSVAPWTPAKETKVAPTRLTATAALNGLLEDRHERFLSMAANLDRNGLIAVVAVLLNLPMRLTPV